MKQFKYFLVIKLLTIIFLPSLLHAQVASFKHQASGGKFLKLLEKVQKNVPNKLKGYLSQSIINGSVEALGNFDRPIPSTLTIDLVGKKLSLRVIDPPKKDGARQRSGSFTFTAEEDNAGFVWVQLSPDVNGEPAWKLAVNVVGETLQGPSDSLNNLPDQTYNLKAKAEDAGFKVIENVNKEYDKKTEFLFTFGIDSILEGVYFDREVKNATAGEVVEVDPKDPDSNPADNGKPIYVNLKVRISVTAEKPTTTQE